MNILNLVNKKLNSHELPKIGNEIDTILLDNNELSNLDFLEKGKIYKKICVNTNKIKIEKLENIECDLIMLNQNLIERLEVINCNITSLNILRNEL